VYSVLRCLSKIISFTLLFIIDFTAAIINLIDHLPWLQGAPADGVGDQPPEDHPGTTFLDGPQCGAAAKSQLVLLETKYFC
jgi:hypothetical protein